MATPAQGGNGFLQFKREAVYGTDLPATKRMPCTIIDFQIEANKIRSKSMDGSRVRPAIFASTVLAKVTIEVECQYVTGATDPTGIMMLSDAIFGTDSFGSEGFTTTGGPTYSHVYKMNHALMNSLLLELGDGSPGAAGTCVQLTGAKVLNAEWNVGLGDDAILRLRFQVLGKAMTTGVTPTAGLSAQTFDPILGSHVAITDFITGGTTLWQSIKITLNNNLLEEGYLGSTDTREPVLNGFASVVTEMTGDFDSYALLGAFLNHTVSNATFAATFTKPTTSLQYVLQVASGRAYAVGHTHQVSGTEGIVRQTVRWESIKDANSSGLVLTIVGAAPETEG